jgi:hypothetical protein
MQIHPVIIRRVFTLQKNSTSHTDEKCQKKFQFPALEKIITTARKIDPKRAPQHRMSLGLFSSGIGIDPDYRGRGS